MPRFVSIVVVAALAGCQGVREDQFADDYAQAYCRAHVDCGCETPWPGEDLSYGECLRILSEDLSATMADARAAGLEFWPDCAAQRLEELDFVSDCRAQSGWSYAETQASLERSCSIYVGNLGLGEDCEPAPDPGLGSTCGFGLTCVSGRCERHYATVGQSCEMHADCLRSWCEEDECTELLDEGDGCKSAAACKPELFCERQMEECVVRPGEGEECGFEFGAGWLNACVPELRCTADSFCAEPLPLGSDCVLSQDCPPGSSCQLGTCQLDPAALCGLTLVDPD